MKVIVIMAGGAGERFWPLSRHTQPKQLLKLTGSGQSLLEEAVERSMAIVPPANIYIATGQHLKQAIIDADLVGRKRHRFPNLQRAGIGRFRLAQPFLQCRVSIIYGQKLFHILVHISRSTQVILIFLYNSF